MSKETFYFPHDYDSTSDPKMQAFIGKYGGLGYGIFWRVVEMLHSNSDHKLPLKQYIFSAIAKQMLTSDEQMLEIIKYAIEFCELFESDQINFWSKRVDKNIEKRAEISEKRSIAGRKGFEVKYGNQAIAKQIVLKEKKRKEIKEKEIKEKNNTTPPDGVFVLPDYIPEETWKAYLEVRNKKRAAKTTYALNLIIKELEKYKPNQLEILNQSIKNGYVDMWPLKEKNNGNKITPQAQTNPYIICDKCGAEVLKTDLEEINGKKYCVKCPEFRDSAERGYKKISDKLQLGG